MAARVAEKAAEAAENAQVKNDTQATENAQEAAQSAAERVKLVYIGPTLPKGQLKQNTIFIGTQQEIEKELEKVLAKYPICKNLLVPVASLATAKVKIKTPGNMLHKWSADVISLITAELSKESEV